MDLNTIKFKNTLNKLSVIKGNNTSMLSILLPYNEHPQVIIDKLIENISSSSNIKSKITKDNVESISKSAIEKLKLIGKNANKKGYCIYVGIDINNVKYNIMFEPIKPITCRLYHYDNAFIVEDLMKMLTNEVTIGYVHICGTSFIICIVKNGIRTVLVNNKVSLPKKHNKGGQSSVRFARLRDEKKLIYTKQCIETLIKTYNNNKDIAQFFIGGVANMESEIYGNNELPVELRKIFNPNLIKTSNNDMDGMNYLIDNSYQFIEDMNIKNDLRILDNFKNQLYKDDDKICIGINNVLNSLVNNQLSHLIVYENIELYINYKDGVINTCKDDKHDDYIHLFDFINMYINKNLTIDIISDKTGESTLFIKNFNGLVGITMF